MFGSLFAIATVAAATTTTAAAALARLAIGAFSIFSCGTSAVFLAVFGLGISIGFSAFGRSLCGALLGWTLAILFAALGTATTATATTARPAFTFASVGVGCGLFLGFFVLDLVDDIIVSIVFDDGAIDADMLGSALLGIGDDPGVALLDGELVTGHLAISGDGDG